MWLSQLINEYTRSTAFGSSNTHRPFRAVPPSHDGSLTIQIDTNRCRHWQQFVCQIRLLSSVLLPLLLLLREPASRLLSNVWRFGPRQVAGCALLCFVLANYQSNWSCGRGRRDLLQFGDQPIDRFVPKCNNRSPMPAPEQRCRRLIYAASIDSFGCCWAASMPDASVADRKGRLATLSRTSRLVNAATERDAQRTDLLRQQQTAMSFYIRFSPFSAATVSATDALVYAFAAITESSSFCRVFSFCQSVNRGRVFCQAYPDDILMDGRRAYEVVRVCVSCLFVNARC